MSTFLDTLPFALTDSQRRAITEIHGDLAAPAPMHRLLQGEVGSGKTVVALAALLVAVQGGYQGAFLAPTEVLAEQHELTLRSLARRAHRHGRGHAARRTAGAGRAVDQPHPRCGPSAPERRVARRRRRHRRRHPRAPRSRRRVPPPRARDHRRAAPLRGRATRRPAGQGRRPRRAGHDGHPDPADRGDAPLRRPRQVGAAGAPRRSVLDRHRDRWPQPPRTHHRLRPAPSRGRRGPAGVRRLPPRRRLGAGRGDGRDRPSTSGSNARSWPGCGSGCSTGSSPAPTRRR